jgi:phosphate transport system permease protein
MIMSQNGNSTGKESFTGRRFSRKPRKSVMFTDNLARRLITLSGIGSIVAVSLVGLFLVYVVLPLFTPTGLEELSGPVASSVRKADGSAAPVVHQTMDDYGSLVWSLHEGGIIQLRELEGGRLLDEMVIQPGREVTALKVSGHQGRTIVGFADGAIQTLKIAFTVEFLEDEDVSSSYHALTIGEKMAYGAGLIERTPEGQLRHIELNMAMDEPVQLGEEAIRQLDVSETSGGLVVVAMDQAGWFHDRKITWRQNLLTGEMHVKSRGHDLSPADLGLEGVALPWRMVLNDAGDMSLLIWQDGRTRIIERGPEGEFAVSGETDLVPGEGARLTSLAFIAGRVSLAVGDDQGGLTVWFPVRESPTRPPVMQPVHHLGQGQGVVTALASSGRSRLLFAGYRDGTVRLFHVTSHRFLGEAKLDSGPVIAAAIAPREDQLIAANATDNVLWHLDAPHPDISFGALLRPVWYEGYPGPSYVWQSSAATDTFEPKLSLVPLIAGTLKATFYSMLFGLPLALLAALYTSEFLHRRTRTRIKPVIETMASLPSVVLGFLAALVMAPFVEKVLVEVLTILFGGPFFLLVAAHLWQMLPSDWSTRLDPFRPVGILLAIAGGGAICWSLAPFFEDVAFAGDVKLWLDGQVGSGVTGWFLMLLAPSALVVGWANINYGEGILRGRGPGWSRLSLACLDLGRFLAGSALTVAMALFLGWLLESSGWDPRGSVLDTYVQRNALVVGFAMGFAVIPIIYSIAEDALSAVPDHLRAASLGAGATLWQTAIKVIVPPAMSGLFSAGMIGLGRAVGETMIVLMAAGNTPIMDMNIFNGFRTLSANLAVELPEAVQNSTHYRTLFLAALTLFIMTFILNTVAETVRLHFRRKSSQL